MSKTAVQTISLLCFSFLPIPALAQCTDQPCQNLQNILDAAITDFRPYGADKTGGPELSINGMKFVCQMRAWANNVSMYMCYTQVSQQDAQNAYSSILDALKRLKLAWRFQVSSPDGDHFVRAGPPDCENPPNDGPYIGDCPLQLQTVKEKDGTVRLHFWMNSLSSPYLVKRPPSPKTAPKSVPKNVPRTSAGDCDDFCLNFKMAFTARLNSFADIRTAKTNGEISDAIVKLEGAEECMIKGAAKPPSNEVGTEFVCYWPETSGPAAETRFRDLIARIQGLLPSDWTTHQETESYENTGATITKWSAIEPGGKHDVRIYVSGDAVGLHITTWN
ncbi:MAG: hypothetical protein DMG44_09500 [Acidobacteria bacterium]|nr:MAG: hypothetical protein DMG44_09500 [Acidobacteriota bacterium]